MWNRRDFVLLATAAFATFGLTVATFWPRTATAVGETPAATTEVKVPTLDLGNVQVTAALDTAHGRTVIFSVRNRAKSATTATFTAEANVTQPISMMSRALPVGQEVWKQEYTVNLQPGETKELAVELPEAAFVKQKSQPAPKPNSKQTPLLMRPGSSYLTLSAQDTPEPQSIRALTLTTVKPVPTAAAKGNS